MAAETKPMPAAFAGVTRPKLNKKAAAIVGTPFIVALAVALGLAWNAFGLQFSTIPITGPVSLPPSSWSLFSDLAAPTRETPAPATNNVDPTSTNCPIPQGWVIYTVSPTDSLYRLSVIYGVSLETLQEVNCLGDNTVILPGQVIYVPEIPTSTPTVTVTLAPVIPSNTINAVRQLEPTASPKPHDDPPPTRIPPTSEPPTAVPPTPVPPTPVPPTKEPVKPTVEPPSRPPDVGPTNKPKDKEKKEKDDNQPNDNGKQKTKEPDPDPGEGQDDNKDKNKDGGKSDKGGKGKGK